MINKHSWHQEDDGALKRFKQSLSSGRDKYFDVSEFEEIVENLLAEGDVETSEKAVLQGMQMHPNASPLHIKYAQVLINQGKYKKALEGLERAKIEQVGNPDYYLLKGTALLMLGEDKKAAIDFNKSISFAGEDKDNIYFNIASTYLELGNFDQAVYYYEKTLEANPRHEAAMYELAFFYEQKGDVQKSINVYDRFLDIDPYNYSAWFSLGVLYNHFDQYDKAIEAYEFVLAIKEDFYQALYNMGNAYANKGNFEKAVEMYLEYTQYDSENDAVYCYLGECWLNLDSMINAEFYYQRALQVNKKNDTAWFGLGLVYWIDQKLHDSIIHIHKAIEIDENNSEYWLTLAKVYSEANKYEKALETIQEVSLIEPEYTEIWFTYADILLKNGDVKKAIDVLLLAIEKNDDVFLKYKIADVLLKKKDDRAYYWIKKALLQHPDKLQFLYDINPKTEEDKKIKSIIESLNQKNNNNET